MKGSSLISRLRTRLNDIPIRDPAERRMASLLQITLIGLMVIVILATTVLVLLPDLSVQEKLNLLKDDLFGLLVVAFPLALLRRGYFRGSAIIIISILFITPTLAVTVVFDLLNSGGILFEFTLAIILAGLLVSRRALMIVFGLSVLMVGFSAVQGQSAAPHLIIANLEIAVNFILFNGLIALFIDRFGATLRASLNDALERENELQKEISNRKQAEATLSESEGRYRDIFQTAAISIWEEDYSEVKAALDELRVQGVIDFRDYLMKHPDFVQRAAQMVKVLDVNDATLKLYGAKDKTEFLGSLGRFVIPDNLHEELIAFAEGKTYFEKETSDSRLDGSPINFWMAITFLADTAGFHKALVCLSDITERKRTEEALREAETKYRELVERLPVVIYTSELGAIGIWHYVSPHIETLLGFTPEEWMAESSLWYQQLHPDDRDRQQALEEQAYARGEPFEAEYRMYTRAGREIWIRDSAQILPSSKGGLPIVQGVLVDITERKQAEKDLNLNKVQLLANLDNTPNVAIQWYDADGHILYWNPASESTYGWKSEEAIGKTLDQLIHTSEEQAGFMRILAEIEETRRPFGPYEAQVHHKNGTPGWVLATTFSIPIDDGQMGFVCMDVDITEQKRAEEKIQRQNQRLKVLREIDTAILSADSVENVISAALSHIRELIDCRRASITLIDWASNTAEIFDVKTTSETSIPKGTRVQLGQFQDMIQTLSKDQPVLINDLRVLANPSPQLKSFIKDGLCALCVLPLFAQGNLMGVFSMSSEIAGFFDDEQMGLGREVANQVSIAITQSRLLDALRESNAELERHAREREELIKELTAKNAELENFTYTVSHDLKSPLVTIKGFLGYLEQHALSGNVEKLKDDSRRIGSAVEKMQELLNDLLELSRIGRFVSPSESIPFEELVRVAIEMVDGRIQQRGVAIQIQPNLPNIYGDRQRLIGVLQNLLDNAAKYMGDRTNPIIEIGMNVQTASDNPVFFVRDNGIGIAHEFHERVFGLFNKLDARTEGTGIGLALVRRIIEFHGGRIWMESEPGQGSTFYFTLPPKPKSDSGL